MQSESIFPAQLMDAAAQLADVLQQTQTRIVFAESCTAGLVSASLATVPGISSWMCGSAVTYQEATKVRWVDVPWDELREFSAVSDPVARSMARGVLQITPHADVAVSVTGHLGPGAPASLDGVIFIGAAVRHHPGDAVVQTGSDPSGLERPNGIESVVPDRLVLNAESRQSRQVEAAVEVLRRAKTLAQMRK